MARQEIVRSYIFAGGDRVTLTVRTDVTVEDPYLIQAKAKAYGILNAEPESFRLTPRRVKDYLIKTNISI